MNEANDQCNHASCVTRSHPPSICLLTAEQQLLHITGFLHLIYAILNASVILERMRNVSRERRNVSRERRPISWEMRQEVVTYFGRYCKCIKNQSYLSTFRIHIHVWGWLTILVLTTTNWQCFAETTPGANTGSPSLQVEELPFFLFVFLLLVLLFWPLFFFSVKQNKCNKHKNCLLHM